ncbi:MAG: hypothetical protein QXS85_02065 [Acidilobaceae archaeon]
MAELDSKKARASRVFDRNLYGLYLRLNVVSMMRYGMCFAQLALFEKTRALEVVREVAGGEESSRVLAEIMESILMNE